MKAFIKFALLFTSVMIVFNIKAQNPNSDVVSINDSAVAVNIQDKEIQAILNRVLPNVTYEFHYTMGIIPYSRNFSLKYENKIYLLNNINKLLLEIKYSGDSLPNFSDEDLIRTFVYLSMFGSIDELDQKLEFHANIKQIDKFYKGELLDYYQRIGFNNLKLNYHCSANLINIKRSKILVNWDMDFNIIDAELISMVGLKTNLGEIDRRSRNFYVFEQSAEMEKYNPTGREYTIKYLKEKKREPFK